MASGDITATRANLSDVPCAVFDGVDDYVEIPHNPNQLGANLSNGFTISAWINPKTFGESNSGRILDKSSNSLGEEGFRFGVGAGNSNMLFNINNGTLLGSSNNSISVKVWTHVLVTISSSQKVNFYKNGVLSGTENQDLVQGISTITTTNAMRIGNRSGATDRTFDGGIRQVKMWNRVLTTDEITEEYNGKNHTYGLIHYLKLGGDYKDYGSVGVDATNSGSIANTTLPLQLQTNAKQLNLAAVTDKIICVPRPGRNGQFALIGANRAA